MEVIKKVEEHIARTDVWYYCPKCCALLWNSISFPYPMRSKCPKCKCKIEWSELRYFEDIDAYAISQEVVDKYKAESEE